MNNIQTLHTIYIASLTAAIVMFVITLILFFAFDMRHVIGRMLGFAEKKAIKEMEANTSFTSQLNDKYNRKMKDKVFTNTGSLKKRQTPAEMLGMTSVPPQVPDNNSTSVLAYGTSETTALGYADSEAATTQLDFSEENTTQLKVDYSDEQTTVLSQGLGGGAPPKSISNLQFTVTQQIMYIHTDECI